MGANEKKEMGSEKWEILFAFVLMVITVAPSDD
jgi:hypothetical protein